MAYATVADIDNEFKSITFDADSALTDAEISSFIAQEEASINVTISNRYEVPITGANSVLVMANISVAYVAYRVAKVLNLKKDVPIPEKFVPQVLNEGAKYKEAKQQLMDIQSGRIILNDAVARSSGQGVRSYNATNSVLPLWERDKRQW